GDTEIEVPGQRSKRTEHTPDDPVSECGQKQGDPGIGGNQCSQDLTTLAQEVADIVVGINLADTSVLVDQRFPGKSACLVAIDSENSITLKMAIPIGLPTEHRRFSGITR